MGLHRWRESLPDQPIVHAMGFSVWKRPLLRRFLHNYKLVFVRHVRQIPDNATLALWASGTHRNLLRSHPCANRILLEDGFLRSVGLGAFLVRPLSWVADTRGMHYEAVRPSDLEVLLQTADFDPTTLRRARALRETLLAAGITKYNVGTSTWPGVSRRAASRQEIVLVPGQVESDASVLHGAPGICTNLDLLRSAREMHPRAWLIYKPHPDVVAGLRRAGSGENDAWKICDEVVTDAPMGKVLQAVDIVHVLTSLAGFEALLRNKRVVCHGVPFYSGWGLTEDLWPAPRRSKRLCLEELIAGALIHYPIYVSRMSGMACTVEQAVTELIEWTNTARTLPWWRKSMRPFLRSK